MNRRQFLGGALGFGAAYALEGAEVLKQYLGKERLRFGVLSDVHISTEAQLPYFEKALRRLDELKVDGVLCCGDIADYGMVRQLQLAADTWFKVFPNNRRSDGEPVANLLHYGDHDMQDERYVDFKDAAARWPDHDARVQDVIHRKCDDHLAADQRAKAAWERCFKCNDWAPIVYKEVKGYPFVLSHFTRGQPDNQWGNNVPGLEAFLKAHKFDSKKPVFYSQHRVPRGTVCGDEIYGQDDGQTTKIFSKYPNLIAFCGHAHLTGVCEKSIWQGAFTCIQVPSLRYTTTLSGRENGYSHLDKNVNPARTMRVTGTGKCNQGFICRVFDDAIVITRENLTAGERLGPDWVIPMNSFSLPAAKRPFAYENRAKVAPVPQFPADAKVVVKPTKAGQDRAKVPHQFTPVEFPPVTASAEAPRANDYLVVLENQTEKGVKEVVRRRVFSSVFLGDEKTDVIPVTCLFAEYDFPMSGKWRFAVRPCNAFGGTGNPIYSEWKEG